MKYTLLACCLFIFSGIIVAQELNPSTAERTTLIPGRHSIAAGISFDRYAFPKEWQGNDKSEKRNGTIGSPGIAPNGLWVAYYYGSKYSLKYSYSYFAQRRDYDYVNAPVNSLSERHAYFNDLTIGYNFLHSASKKLSAWGYLGLSYAYNTTETWDTYIKPTPLNRYGEFLSEARSRDVFCPVAQLQVKYAVSPYFFTSLGATCHYIDKNLHPLSANISLGFQVPDATAKPTVKKRLFAVGYDATQYSSPKEWRNNSHVSKVIPHDGLPFNWQPSLWAAYYLNNKYSIKLAYTNIDQSVKYAPAIETPTDFMYTRSCSMYELTVGYNVLNRHNSRLSGWVYAGLAHGFGIYESTAGFSTSVPGEETGWSTVRSIDSRYLPTAQVVVKYNILPFLFADLGSSYHYIVANFQPVSFSVGMGLQFGAFNKK